MKRIFYFWLHLVIVLIILASPFFIDWKFILGGIILY